MMAWQGRRWNSSKSEESGWFYVSSEGSADGLDMEYQRRKDEEYQRNNGLKLYKFYGKH